MVQINFAQKTVNVKIVYYGPGMSGKTTNLEVLHERAPETNCGDLTSISTDGDRTLFFDYMPLDLGTVAGMRTCFQLYTVPGQVYYNSTRKLVLQGVDGVIFVADSSGAMTEQNLESLRNLEENLNEYGKSLATMPHVIQYNKRDLPDALDTAELDRLMNNHGAPTFEAVANVGTGVFPTLKALAANVLKTLMHENSKGGQPQPSAPMPAAQPAGAPMAAAPVAQGAAPAAPVAPGTPAPPAPNAGMPPGQPAQPAQAYASGAPAAQPPAAPASGGLELASSVPDRASPVSAAPSAHAAPQAHAPQAAHPAQQRSEVQRPRPAAKPPARPNAAPQAPRAQRRAAAAKREAIAAPAPKKKGAMTGAFVVLAAGAGAVLAWFALKLL